MGQHRVVIVGGGFGGLYAAKALGRMPVDITLIDRRNFHLFQPLLYQVATGGLSPGDIANPLRAILRKNRRARVVMGDVIGIDAARSVVKTRDEEIAYDVLVLATGVRHAYFGHDEWEGRAPGLKTIEDALEMRRRIFRAFERAEVTSDPELRRALLTFVVVGAGPTGVELAGALGELAHKTLRGEFRRFDPEEARIFLVEGAGRVLPTYAEPLSSKAQRRLERLGVTVETSTFVTDISDGVVTLKRGEEIETIRAETVLWAAGVRATEVSREFADAFGAETDKVGRIKVLEDLTMPGHPNVFVIGDLSAPPTQPPGVAQTGMQMGAYVAKTIRARMAGKSLPPFRYRDKGSLAVIGRGAAVADIWGLRFNGVAAWLVWACIHITYLIGFDNRILVMIQWAYGYLTYKRGARLIGECTDDG